MSRIFPTVVAALAARIRESPDTIAFRYLTDGEVSRPAVEWTYRVLGREACRIAAALEALSAPGDRVLLLHASGLEFVAALFACLVSGRIAVPAYPPDPRQLARSLERLAAMIADAGVHLILADGFVASALKGLAERTPELRGLKIVATDGLPAPPHVSIPNVVDPEAVAYLQYTSGSTGRPRGVVIRHRNIVANIGSSVHMKAGPGMRSVAWLPLYHDLGLVAFVLSPVVQGFESTLFSPLDFLRRPARWVEAISHLRATHTAAPSFAYDLVARKTPREQVPTLDLSHLIVAGAGAEPIRPQVLDRFAETFAPAGFRVEALQPTYGLAETVLYATFKQDLGARDRRVVLSSSALARGRVEYAEDGPDASAMVSSGPIAPGHRMRIVDPETSRACRPDTVGEIWISGPSVADGYWRDDPDSASCFGARLAEEPDRVYLRTGDLGFLHDGELVVTGRLKDLVIIGGRNLYPQDIELTVEAAHASVRPGCVAAFAIEIDDGEAVGVVAEVREEAAPEELTAALAAIREAVSQAHEVGLERIVLVSAASIPKTSSGKIRRRAARQALEERQLAELTSWSRPKASGSGAGSLLDAEASEAAPVDPPARLDAPELRRLLCAWLARELGGASVDPERPLAEYIDSVVAVALARELEARTGKQLPPNIAWSHPTVALLARHLAEDPCGARMTALLPAPPRERYPLSFTEVGLFRLLERQPVQAAYNLFFPLALTGEIDPAALEAGFRALLARHDNLRTAFELDDRQPTRRILDRVDFGLETIDLRSLAPDEQQTAVVRASDRVRHRTFDLARPPLLAAELLRISPTDWILLLCINHLAVDAWSAGILIRDLGLLYEAARRGEAAALPRLPLRCADYAVYSDERFCEVFAKGREAFPPYPEDGYRLPLDHPMPRTPSLVGGRAPFVIPEALCRRLEQLARASGVPISAVMLCGFEVMLHRHARSPRVSFTIVRANRQLAGLEEVVGYLVYGETLDSVLGGVDYRTMLLRARDVVEVEPEERQPYNVIVQPPSVRVLFNYYGRPMPESLGGLKLQYRADLDPFAYLWDVHDLMLRVFPSPKIIVCEMVYRSEILEPSTIQRMTEELLSTLEEMVASPEQEVRWAPAGST